MSEETTRTLGVTELRERMQQVVDKRDDEALVWPGYEENPPPYFGADGEPLALLGHVLAGLGVGLEQARQLAFYNEHHPEDMFPAAGIALTIAACSAADTVWMLEMREYLWSDCIEQSAPDEHGRDNWLPQDHRSLAEAEAEVTQSPMTASHQQRNRHAHDRSLPSEESAISSRSASVDVTAITAQYPATPPDGMADAPVIVIGYQVWMEAAEAAGEGVTWTVAESTFDVTSVPVDADETDDNVCAAIMVDGTWYVIERDGNIVHARHG